MEKGRREGWERNRGRQRRSEEMSTPGRGEMEKYWKERGRDRKNDIKKIREKVVWEGGTYGRQRTSKRERDIVAHGVEREMGQLRLGGTSHWSTFGRRKEWVLLPKSLFNVAMALWECCDRVTVAKRRRSRGGETKRAASSQEVTVRKCHSINIVHPCHPGLLPTLFISHIYLKLIMNIH